jgi:hypothetical protein
MDFESLTHYQYCETVDEKGNTNDEVEQNHH